MAAEHFLALFAYLDTLYKTSSVFKDYSWVMDNIYWHKIAYISIVFWYTYKYFYKKSFITYIVIAQQGTSNPGDPSNVLLTTFSYK